MDEIKLKTCINPNTTVSTVREHLQQKCSALINTDYKAFLYYLDIYNDIVDNFDQYEKMHLENRKRLGYE